MIERIKSGWSVRRAFYFIAGGGIIVMSLMDQQWFGVIMGGYFAAMGLFAFGCASGHCAGVCPPDSNHHSSTG